MRRLKSFLRRFAVGFLSALALTATSSLGHAWPQRTVRLIVPLGVGGAPDITARLFAERLAERWKQPVIVENRPGAEGVIGVNTFINMRDDHALLFSVAGPITTLPLVHGKASYDSDRDLVPIASAADSFLSIATPASANVSSLSELVARARLQPGKLNYNAGVGAYPYLFAGFLKGAGLEMTLVPYREVSLALNDLVEDRLQVIVVSMAALRAAVHSGKVRYLAVTNKTRAAIASTVPTAAEAGYPQLTYDGLLGFFGARDLSAERRDRIAADVRAITAEPAVANRLAPVGVVARFSGAAEYSAALAEERIRMEATVKLLEHKTAH